MEILPLQSIFPNRMVFAVISLSLILFYYETNANGAYQIFKPDSETYSVVELEKILGDYQARLNVLNEQIRDTRKDLDWLVVKINRISASGRRVPKLLHDSADLKEKKIFRLELEKKHLSLAVGKFRQIHDEEKAREKKNTQIRILSTPDMGERIKKSGKFNVPEKLTGIAQAVKKAGLGDWVDVVADESCTKINTTLPILFSSGSSALAKEYKSFLKKLALFLKPYDVKVYVNGYADPDPIHTTKYPSNLELGASRAANVVHEMVKNGLRPDIFKIGSTGEYWFSAKKQSSKKTFQRRAQLMIVFSG